MMIWLIQKIIASYKDAVIEASSEDEEDFEGVMAIRKMEAGEENDGENNTEGVKEKMEEIGLAIFEKSRWVNMIVPNSYFHQKKR